ncbi:MAG: M48 family metallopeptidase [Rhodoblastus sp.]
MMRLFRRAEDAHAKGGELELRHDGEIYKVQLRRVISARRFILRVRGATRDAVLTVPQRASLKDATEFAQRNAAWVGARLRRLPQQIRFLNGAVFPLGDAQTRIVHAPGMRGVVWLAAEGSDEQKLYVAGDSAHIERRVQDWLKVQAKVKLVDAVRRYADMIGKPEPPITLRDTSTRWGSCSATGALNFSWRLILAPGDVLTYLAAHEVCHLVHMNHSVSFWKLCQSICPETDAAEAWLKANGLDLYRYGAKRLRGAACPEGGGGDYPLADRLQF